MAFDDAQRRRMVADAKTEASLIKLDQAAASATDEERAAAYGAVGKPRPKPMVPGNPLAQAGREALAMQQAAGLAPAEPGAGVAEQAIGAGNRSYEDALKQARMIDSSRVRVTKANPMYRPTREYIDTNRAANEVIADATLDAQAIERQHAEETARWMQDQVARGLAEDAVAQTRQAAREQALADQQDRIRKSDLAVSRAADELSATPGVDPGRFWASRNAAQKVFGVIGALFGGFAGRDGMAHIKSAIADDIDAQKNAQGMRAQALGAREQEASGARDLHARLMAQFGDERTADLVFQQARLEGVKREFDALAARQGAQALTPQQDLFLADLDRELAANKLELDRLQVANSPTISRTVSTMGANERQLRMALAKEGIKEGSALRQQGFEQAGRLEMQQGEMAMKRQDQAQQREGKVYDELSKFAVNTKASGAVVQLSQDMLNEYGSKGVPGRGISSVVDWTDPNEVARFESLQSQLVDEIGRMQSQGAVTPDEAERFQEWLSAGIGDEQYLDNLRNVQSLAQRITERQERALSPEARSYYRRTGALPDFEADFIGAGGRTNAPLGSGVVQVDE